MARGAGMLPLLLAALLLSPAAFVAAQEENACKDAVAKATEAVRSQMKVKCQGEVQQLSLQAREKAQEIAGLKLELAERKEASFGLLARVLVDVLKAQVAAAKANANAVFQEAKQGKTIRLKAMILATISQCRDAFDVACQFLADEADEHMPQVTQKLKAWHSAGKKAWLTHVVEATWAAPIVSRVAAMNAELTGVISKYLRSVPALKPYDDPVVVQLAVYTLFGLPLCVMLLVLSALLHTRKADEGAAAGARRGTPAGRRGGPATRKTPRA